MERKQKLVSGASDEIWEEVLQDVLVWEGKISEMENELHEASDMEEEEVRRKTKEEIKSGKEWWKKKWTGFR